MTPVKSDHMMAFLACVGEANALIRTEYRDELAQVISDHHAEMPGILRQTLNNMQARPFPLGLELPREDRNPVTRTVLLGADRIIDEVHFLENRNAPFLQMRRSSFRSRRYFARQSSGEDYLLCAISGIGTVKTPDDWNMSLGVISQKEKLIIAPPPNRVILIGRQTPESPLP